MSQPKVILRRIKFDISINSDYLKYNVWMQLQTHKWIYASFCQFCCFVQFEWHLPGKKVCNGDSVDLHWHIQASLIYFNIMAKIAKMSFQGCCFSYSSEVIIHVQWGTNYIVLTHREIKTYRYQKLVFIS